MGLKAIIFDLGGVIIDLHYDRTAKMLATAAGIKQDEIGDLLVTSDVLQRFEVGGITEKQFREEVCELLRIEMSDAAFDDIWNSILGKISKDRIERIKKVKHRTLILSNTNGIHERAFNETLRSDHGVNDLHELVDRVYFSHEVGLRKPDKGIYTYVLEQERLKPQEVLFIDDRADNIDAAKEVGLQTFHNRNINDWLAKDI